MERDFPKDISSLESIFDHVSQFAEQHGIGPELTREMHFAVEEVVTNMIRYNTESRNDITIGLCVENGAFRVWVADRDVHSFDPTQRPPVDTTQPPHERMPGGLGIHLIREMMDDVLYEYVDRTAKITLIKRLEK